MKLKAGIFLKSTPALEDTYFAETSIFLTEYNDNGAVGFVINRPFGRSLNELEEFRHSPRFVLYEGGPVDKEHLFFLHRQPERIKDGTFVGDGVWWGGNFTQAVSGISSGSLSSNDLKIFVGYCGWDAGELEAEIEEGSWTIADASSETIFS